MQRVTVLCVSLLLPFKMWAQQDSTRKPVIPMQQLEAVEILSEYEKYRRDSLNLYETYHKSIDDAKRKVKLEFATEALMQGQIGFYAPGAVSSLASAISGKKKRDRKFYAQLKKDQAEKFIAIRYNESVVNSTVGLSGDTAAVFMNTYPMTEEFARVASPLELKMWIRDNYKLWMNRPKDTAIAKP